VHNVAFLHFIEKFLGPRGCLVNRNNALGGRDVIAFSNMGGAQPEIPTSLFLQQPECTDSAILTGGDLRKINAVRDFWKLAIEALELQPNAIWLNLTEVVFADTKLAACIVAILRRAELLGTEVYIIGSSAVLAILQLCKVPPLKHFTKVA